MTERHRLLRRQVARHLGPEETWSEGLKAFVEAVQAAYHQSDLDRALLERSLDLSSKELLQANADMTRSVSLLQATFESTADGILVVDSTGRIVNFNQNFVDLWRIPDSVLRTQDDDAALAFVLEQLSEPERFIAKVAELYGQPEAESFDELQFKDGRTFERYSKPHRVGGKCVGRVWSFRDVTPRRQAEEALRQSEEQLRQSKKMEAVGQLAGGIAHDFNNLLTTVSGYSELLVHSLQPRDAERRYAEAIHDAAHRAAQLTRQLLAFSRKQVLAPRVLNINRVLASMERMLGPLLGEHIELVTRFEASGNVEADPGQIEQVVMNLAINARDAMKAGGRLTIETADVEIGPDTPPPDPEMKPGAYLGIRVADTGSGIEPAALPRIFEPFFTTKPRGRGTGLGLATVYGIVRQSGGHVVVHSLPGLGTTFEIYLPRVLEIETAETLPGPSGSEGGRETLVLVEDQQQVRELAGDVLRNLGYEVIEANSGPEALDLIDQLERQVDLLVTDVVMPGMSGRELAARVLELRPGTRVLYMSGYTDDVIAEHGVLDEGIWFLEKPFSPKGLGAKVREVLDAVAEPGLRPHP